MWLPLNQIYISPGYLSLALVFFETMIVSSIMVSNLKTAFACWIPRFKQTVSLALGMAIVLFVFKPNQADAGVECIVAVVGGYSVYKNIVDKSLAKHVRDSYVPIAIGEYGLGGASLISSCKNDSIFLTVAHNIVDNSGKKPGTSVLLKNNPNLDGDAGFSDIEAFSAQAVESAKYVPGSIDNRFDLGLVRVKKDFSGIYKIKKIVSQSDLKNLNFDEFIISGAGQTNKDNELDYTLNYGTMVPEVYPKTTSEVENFGIGKELTLVPKNGITCGGDSGGAVEAWNGKEMVQIGVIAAGNCVNRTFAASLIDPEVRSHLRSLFNSLNTKCPNPF